MSMIDSRASSLPSTMSTLAERLDYSSSPVIVGKFAKALIPLDADGEAKKTSDVG